MTAWAIGRGETALITAGTMGGGVLLLIHSVRVCGLIADQQAQHGAYPVL